MIALSCFYLPPFLDLTSDATPDSGSEERNGLRAKFAKCCGISAGKHWLLAVAMMRSGDKLHSYRLLARGLTSLPGDDWQLIVVGDGEARADVEAAFSSLGVAGKGGRIAWAGELTESTLREVYSACDVFVWPAINEAYGMVLLEAQAAGLPLVVGNEGGVRDVVCDGVTGILVNANEPSALAAAVRNMLDNDSQRRMRGINGKKFVRQERSLATASDVVNDAVFHATNTRHVATQRTP